MSERIQIKAELRETILLPTNVGVWIAPQSADRDTGEPRFVLCLTAHAESESVARDLLRLAMARLAAGVSGAD